MKATREDVAKLAGVSTATVSYVVNNGPRPVAAETRQRVLWAIEKLDYHPNAIARSLVTNRTKTVGFILPDILNPSHTAITRAFGDALWTADYSLILGNSDEDAERELAHLQDFVRKGVDGIGLTPTGKNLQMLFSLVEAEKHLVLLDRQLVGLDVDCVLFDNVGGTYQAVRHLVELGHERIGLINLPSSLTPGRERLDGYERALLESGLRIDQQLIREGGFKAEDRHVRSGEGEGLATSLLEVTPPPTAIFVSNNRLMRGVLHLVKLRKIRVPGDLALATFDDVTHYADYTPSITAVATSLTEFGKTVAQLLIERIQGEYTGGPRIIRIPSKLQIRESTRG
jgi:LacI family transcriptional regulator